MEARASHKLKELPDGLYPMDSLLCHIWDHIVPITMPHGMDYFNTQNALTYGHTYRHKSNVTSYVWS